MKKLLCVGLILSAISKILQIAGYGIVGDFLILFAAPFLVLAILLCIPKYKMLYNGPKTKTIAVRCAIYTCLTVFFFQLFTMISFGWKSNIGYVFILPFVISGIILIITVLKI